MLIPGFFFTDCEVKDRIVPFARCLSGYLLDFAGEIINKVYGGFSQNE